MKKLQLASAADVLKTIGNLKRLEILFLLKKQEMNVGDLQKLIGLSQSALSQHLAILRGQKIVKTRRDAQIIYYSLHDDKVIRMLHLVEELF